MIKIIKCSDFENVYNYKMLDLENDQILKMLIFKKLFKLKKCSDFENFYNKKCSTFENV